MDVDDGEEVGILVHGNGTGRRRYKTSSIRIRPELSHFTDTMLKAYPAEEKPYSHEMMMDKFTMELVIEKYSFYPQELLQNLESKHRNKRPSHAC